MQSRSEHRHRGAEALVDAALAEFDELDAGQAPAEQRRAQHRGQDRGTQEGEGPAAREVQSKVGAQQGSRRARTTRDHARENAVGDGACVRRGGRGQEQSRQGANRQFQHHQQGQQRHHPLRPAQPAEHGAAAQLDAGGGAQQQSCQQQQAAQRGRFGQLRFGKFDHDALADERHERQGEDERGEYVGARGIIRARLVRPQKVQRQESEEGPERHDERLAQTCRDTGVLEDLSPTGANRGAPLFQRHGTAESRQGQRQRGEQAGQGQQQRRQHRCRQAAGDGLVCQGLHRAAAAQRQKRRQQQHAHREHRHTVDQRQAPDKPVRSGVDRVARRPIFLGVVHSARYRSRIFGRGLMVSAFAIVLS